MNGKYEDFSRRLIEIMRQKNISSSELCEKADISKQSLSQYICGSRLPQAQALINLSDALGVSIDYLLTGKEKENIIDSEGLTKAQINYLTESAEIFKRYNNISLNQARILQQTIDRKIYEHAISSTKDPLRDWIEELKNAFIASDSSQNN